MSVGDPLLERLEFLNTRDCLWMYILRILKDGPKHAYGLRGDIEKRFGFRPGTVTAYRVLYHLKAKGFVSRKASGRRNLYAVTPSGKDQLKKALEFYKRQQRTLA